MKANRFRFRAWDEKNKRFALACGENYFHLIGECTMFDLLNQYRLEEYDDLIMEQSTGLLDSKGVEIFEGDLIVHPDRNGGKPHSIVWSKNDAALRATYNSLFYNPNEGRMGIEVIGNMHEENK